MPKNTMPPSEVLRKSMNLRQGSFRTLKQKTSRSEALLQKKGKKRKKTSYKPGKALEIRVAEEEKKLEELKKKQPKSKKQKKQEKDKELSDKVKAKKKANLPKEGIKPDIDYQRFLAEQQQKLDYAAMFSYLGNLKLQTYEYGAWDDSSVKALFKKNETISYEEIMEVTEDTKMNLLMNLDRNFEVSGKREAYKWWKAFNKGFGEYLIEVSLT